MPQRSTVSPPPMTPTEEAINTFLVDVFNDVLRLENESLRRSGCRQLSVSELHMLEAVQGPSPPKRWSKRAIWCAAAARPTAAASPSA